jgi:hypothetical protein
VFGDYTVVEDGPEIRLAADLAVERGGAAA